MDGWKMTFPGDMLVSGSLPWSVPIKHMVPNMNIHHKRPTRLQDVRSSRVQYPVTGKARVLPIFFKNTHMYIYIYIYIIWDKLCRYQRWYRYFPHFWNIHLEKVGRLQCDEDIHLYKFLIELTWNYHCPTPRFSKWPSRSLTARFPPEKLPGPNRKGSSSNHHFSGAFAVKLQGISISLPSSRLIIFTSGGWRDDEGLEALCPWKSSEMKLIFFFNTLKN